MDNVLYTGGGSQPLSYEAVVTALAPYGVRLSDEQIGTVIRYINLLMLWNDKLSLTALDDPIEIVARHFGESIFGGQIIGMQGGRLADVGTGAGFPGLALKIALPELDLTMIESNTKKCAFLRELVLTLGLGKVHVFRGPYAEFRPEASKFDYICSRALGDFRNLLNWSAGALAPSGSVLLWVGQEDSIRLAKVQNWVWDLPTPIPESKRRVMIVGRPRLPLIARQE